LTSGSTGAVGGANGPSASVDIGASVPVETASVAAGAGPGRSLAFPGEQATSIIAAIITRKATRRV